MRTKIILALSTLLLLPAATAQPSIENIDTFPQDTTEEVYVDVEAEQADSVTAEIKNSKKYLTDRNNDNYYVTPAAFMLDEGSYDLEVTACGSNGCTTSTQQVTVTCGIEILGICLS